MDANDVEANGAGVDQSTMGQVLIDESIRFDHSDEIQNQINQKQKEIQMKTAMELRAQFMNQSNIGGLQQAGYPMTSFLDPTTLNLNQLEMQKLLMNPDAQMYNKSNDQVYEQFRQTIRDREAFQKEKFKKEQNKKIQLSEQIKIWQTKKAIEDDAKAKMLKQKQQEEKEKERLENNRYCSCFRKKKVKLTSAQREKRKQTQWNSRVKKKRTDNHYKKATKQGWQGEPEPYSVVEVIEQFQEQKFDDEPGFWSVLYYYFQNFLALFIFLFVADKIMNWFQPGYHQRFVDEWGQFGQLFTYAYDMTKKLVYFILKLPEIVIGPLLR